MINEEILKSCKPVNGYLLVKPAEKKEQKTASGIVLANMHTDDSICMAQIIASPEDLAPQFPVGKHVVYQNNGYDAYPSFKLEPADPKSKHLLLNKQFVLMLID